MLEVGHTYNIYDFAIEFKIAMLGTYHKLHIEFLFYHYWLQIDLNFHNQLLVYLYFFHIFNYLAAHPKFNINTTLHMNS